VADHEPPDQGRLTSFSTRRRRRTTRADEGRSEAYVNAVVGTVIVNEGKVVHETVHRFW
jgi:hypothetical protein